ncbi:PLP-dependent transferase [Sodiomyces alkalinus F11]|uniref:PLP-dependent transferase n=1 Tax=Sodiomyces alkalinus (strain CBS 110278 / VKM F-3762 / F11) TaxID=1314773 RepID=A0A3N2Q5F0_SODAK|nr:PLP-dependent transferase [Sodiomyces alkalinus F11]ROT41855.1 PLP-dependent transferase [Sodiomyces alkalinus F11]
MGEMPTPKKQINLLRGWPPPSVLPSEALKAATARAFSDPAVSVPGLQYAPDPGFPPLRDALAAWLARFYGGLSDPERICITGGASQSIANILASFTDPAVTRAVWMAAPCYFLACPIFEDAGFGDRMKAAPEDEHGVDVEALEERLSRFDEEWESGPTVGGFRAKHRKLYRHIIYLVPTCANPSGKTMPLPRREALVRLARRHDALLLADDVYDFLQWPLDPTQPPLPFPPTDPNLRLPRLSDIDARLPRRQGEDDAVVPDPHGFGHAISNASFSKIVAPAVRTGWVDASPAFARGLAQTGATRSGGAPSHFAAVTLWEMLRSGTLENRLRDVVVPALRHRHARVAAAVEALLVPLGVRTRPSSLLGEHVYGGYFIWLTLPDGVEAPVVARRAREAEDLIIGAGEMFEVYGDEASARFGREVRICFSWEDVENVLEGVERLARVVRDVKEGRLPRNACSCLAGAPENAK